MDISVVVGALLGFPGALFAALLSLVLGGVLSILLSVFRRNLSGLFKNTWGMGRWLVIRSTGAPVLAPVSSGKGVPLGVAIAVATLVVVFGPWPGATR